MKRIKKLIIVIICVVMTVLCTAAAFGEEGLQYNQDKVIYLLNGTYSTASVFGAEDDISGEVNIPSTLTVGGSTYDVVRIESRAFENKTQITSITVGEGLMYIEGYAFAGCVGLRDLYLPDTLVFCFGNAFNGCGNLTVHGYKSGSNLTALKLTSGAEFDFIDGEYGIKDFFAGLLELIKTFFATLKAAIVP